METETANTSTDNTEQDDETYFQQQHRKLEKIQQQNGEYSYAKPLLLCDIYIIMSVSISSLIRSYLFTIVSLLFTSGTSGTSGTIQIVPQGCLPTAKSASHIFQGALF